jgi:hypothetical protein
MASQFKAGKVPNSMRPKGARNKVFRAKRDQRRLEAGERQAHRDSLSSEAQLARLDMMFGPGQGAKRERTRLAKRIAAGPKVVQGTNAKVIVIDLLTGITTSVDLAPLDVKAIKGGKRARREAKEKQSKTK